MLVIQRPKIESVNEEEENKQKFSVSPLEPGFGHTLGNSLRRTLLSSIPGAAITQVNFDDAIHEFDVIEGVYEDVTDILLNLKDVVVRLDSDEPAVLRLDAQGPGEVTAGQFSQTADVEVLSGDLVIATLSQNGRIGMEVTIEKGRGYLSAEGNKDSTTVGQIPVDSIFSPVRRVSFEVEPTRVEQSTDFDRLTLEIETDGSMSPREALASAGGTLRNLIQLVEEMSEEPQSLELTEVVTGTAGSPDLELGIEDLELSERPNNCLKRAQIHTIGELILKSEADLLSITNFGQKSLDEIIEKLDERGHQLALKD
ncbi:MAG: DNA-directed RNA polymerase subunit alpha [Acidimicrobiaceae bacterium]|jgi:DNA-directed RNA polymerase subunit alpha|nr:DNA-directed RNA polymerase subunit alpha [Acidimicrobiaceae bacterium]HAY52056.1 DNA-directed RNA polymerase subunit alpha [Acidimicrobiaceae bacterium]|tara:strand:+ start:1066 stop:2004 length:939 start_codon:yes stop_codon:yes gene_type:complete